MSNKRLKIKYHKAYDYKNSFATGVYGGITVNGMINANFFTDRGALPEYQQIEVNEQGQQIGPAMEQKDSDLVREVQFGALMDVQTARVIVGWLQTKIEEYDKEFPKEK